MTIPPLPTQQIHAVRRRPRFQMLRVIGALILREMATTYGRSAGGYLWAILEPVLGIAFLSLLFSFALHQPGIGKNFPLFYASGYLPFSIALGTITKVANSVRFSRPFLAYSCVTFMDAILARLILSLITNTIVMAIVVLGIIISFGLPFYVDIKSVMEAVVLGIVLAFGIGTLNCYLIIYMPIYEQLWSIATRPLFLVSGVFFTYNAMPDMAQDVLWYNPIVHLVGLMRKGLYPTYHSEYVSIEYVLLVASITLFFGLLLLNRHFKELMES